MTDKYVKIKYYEYLQDLIRLKDQNESYYKLIEMLYDFPFFEVVKNDDNRVRDGLRLRENFIQDLINETGFYYDGNIDKIFDNKECSVLEMLIALSDRMLMIVEGRLDYWFWILLENLGLTLNFTDDAFGQDYDYCTQFVNQVLYIFVNRKYEYDGTGGIFPLLHPIQDQRDIEIWKQLTQYLMENGYFSFD